MKVDWAFFSKRRNVTLEEWIKEYKLNDVEEINQTMDRIGLKPPASKDIQSVLDEIKKADAKAARGKRKAAAKPAATQKPKAAPKKRSTASKTTTRAKRKTTKK